MYLQTFLIKRNFRQWPCVIFHYSLPVVVLFDFFFGFDFSSTFFVLIKEWYYSFPFNLQAIRSGLSETNRKIGFLLTFIYFFFIPVSLFIVKLVLPDYWLIQSDCAKVSQPKIQLCQKLFTILFWFAGNILYTFIEWTSFIMTVFIFHIHSNSKITINILSTFSFSLSL